MLGEQQESILDIHAAERVEKRFQPDGLSCRDTFGNDQEAFSTAGIPCNGQDTLSNSRQDKS